MRSAAEERVWRAFVDVGMESGGELFVPVSAAGEYIDACLKDSLAIAGVDAFRVENDKLKPDLHQIADFSSLLDGEQGWAGIVQATRAEAHRFVGRLPPEPEVWLSFTLLAEEDHRPR